MHSQFSRYRAETLQVGRRRPGTGHGGVKCGATPARGQGLLVRGHGEGVKIVGVLLRGMGRAGEAGEGRGLGWCKGSGTPASNIYKEIYQGMKIEKSD